MKFMLENKKTFVDLQHHAPIKLSQILVKINFLKRIQTSFEALVDSSLAQHCMIANFENNVLIVLTDSATWSTKIRFEAPELIKQLQSTPECATLKKIKCLVRPKEIKKQEKPQEKLKINAQNINLIRQTANNIKDENLREALLQLGTEKKIKKI